MNSMRICIVTSWFPSKSNLGLGSFVQRYANTLTKFGVQVSVITTLGPGDLPLEDTGPLKIYRLSGRFPVLEMIRIFSEITPTIIHVHAPNVFSSNAIIASKIKKIPIVATIHRAEVQEAGSLISMFRKIALRQFDKLICVSEHIKSLAIKSGAPEDRLHVIYTSIDESKFCFRDKVTMRKKHNLPLDSQIVLYVGNLIKRKGVDSLILSLTTLRQTEPPLLLVVGDGEERKNLEELASTVGLEANVKFLGRVSDDDLPELYNASDIFVLPSLSEGHPSALLEAMASKVPVVASDIGGNNETIVDGVNGFLFQAGNSKMLSDKLSILLQDKNLCQQIATKGYTTYMDKFSTQKQFGDYFEAYRSFAKSGEDKAVSSITLLIDNQGLSHYTSYLASGLSKHRKIILLGLSKEIYEITEGPANGVEFIQMGNKLPKGGSPVTLAIRLALFFFSLSNALRKIKFDTVHIQGYLPTFFLLLPLLKLGRKQICWTVHDVFLRPSSAGLRGKLELMYINFLTQPNVLGRNVDSIIVHGSLLKNQLVSKGIQQDKIFVMPHFDYLDLLKLEDGSTSKAEDSDYILLFGMIKPYKGIDVLINAARMVKEKNSQLRILIAGRGDTSYFSEMLNKEDDYLVIRNEYIPYSEVPQIFRKAKFVVLPYSDASQSGIVPLAYTFSKPVIVSNVGSVAEYVDHGVTGYVFERGNARQLADYILDLLLDDDRCALMGENGHQKLLNEMSLGECSRIINGIYQRNK